MPVVPFVPARVALWDRLLVSHNVWLWSCVNVLVNIKCPPESCTKNHREPPQLVIGITMNLETYSETSLNRPIMGQILNGRFREVISLGS